MNQIVFAVSGAISAILFILPFAIVVGIVAFAHELGHFLVARWRRVQVEVFSIGMGPELFGFTDRYRTRWRLSAFPIGGYVRFAGDRNALSAPDDGAPAGVQRASLAAQPLPARAAIVAAGPIASFAAAILAFSGLAYFVGETIVPPRVGGVVAGSAAEKSGFLPGDLVKSIDGRPVAVFQDISNFVSLRPGRAIAFVIERGGRETPLVATPTLTTIEFGGVRERVGRLGITPPLDSVDVLTVHPDLVGALRIGLARCWMIVGVTGDYVSQIAAGRAGADQLAGPIGIAQFSHAAASFGVVALINLAAMLSLSLGLVNLLPVPMLDGGHLLFYAIEGLRGKALSRRSQEFGLRIGVTLVLALTLLVTVNDLRRLFEW